jgi:hypothetical protein
VKVPVRSRHCDLKNVERPILYSTQSTEVILHFSLQGIILISRIIKFRRPKREKGRMPAMRIDEISVCGSLPAWFPGERSLPAAEARSVFPLLPRSLVPSLPVFSLDIDAESQLPRVFPSKINNLVDFGRTETAQIHAGTVRIHTETVHIHTVAARIRTARGISYPTVQYA